MASDQYRRVALDENENAVSHCNTSLQCNPMIVLIMLFIVTISFAFGFGIGGNWSSGSKIQSLKNEVVPGPNGLLDPQSFLPDIPFKEVKFEFPTQYEDTGELGDRLWNELMPLGAGFVRVPYPRKYDMPPSKNLEGDDEHSEIYSMSITHQLHCLAVLRHVIIKYEIGDKSRFAGAGHEYHCLDYIRQAILCAGDTTLDHADIMIDASGSDKKSGFSGTNSTHQCRDWDAIQAFLVENRAGNNTGILV